MNHKEEAERGGEAKVDEAIIRRCGVEFVVPTGGVRVRKRSGCFFEADVVDAKVGCGLLRVPLKT